MTIKINYIGVHQPQETVEVDEEKAKIVYDSWEKKDTSLEKSEVKDEK